MYIYRPLCFELRIYRVYSKKIPQGTISYFCINRNLILYISVCYIFARPSKVTTSFAENNVYDTQFFSQPSQQKRTIHGIEVKLLNALEMQ